MGRPPKGGEKLSTKVPEKVMRDIKRKAAELNGSLGDAVAFYHERYKAPVDEVEQLKVGLNECRRAEEAALEVARAAVRRAERAEDRLSKMSAHSKVQLRHLEAQE